MVHEYSKFLGKKPQEKTVYIKPSGPFEQIRLHNMILFCLLET